MTTSASMNRKRPSPGSAAPIQIASVLSSATSNVQAGYLNSTPGSSAAINSSVISATAGPYGHVNGARSVTNSPNSTVESSDLYNLTNGSRVSPETNNAAQALNLALNDNSQLARITNRNNQLMKIPQGSYFPGPGHTAGLGENSQILGAGTGMQTGPGPNLDMYGDLAPMIRKARGKKANIPPFVQKLSQFVNDPKCDHLIRWSPSGTSFLVLDEDEFSKTLIPDLFKHNNYASFVRQLNMYGFHKVVGLADGSLKTSEQRSKPPSEYKNEFFIRGMPDLMWLIQKPKNTTKRSKGRKKGKADDSDEDGGSDREIMSSSGILDEGQLQPNGGGFIEAPPSQHVQSTISKNQVDQIIQQLDQLRAHQQVMTNAINRLRKDHTQLYEQSIAFQTLHDRHENSISAILTFLATVYDKSLSGHLSSQTLQNLFQPSVDQSQNAGQVMGNPGNAVANMGRAGVVGMGNGQPRTPFKRRPLMLPPVPTHVIGSGMQKNQNDNQNQQQQQRQQQQQQQQQQPPDSFNNTYRSPSIQEAFTSGQLSPCPSSPALSNSQMNTSFFPGMFGNRDDNNPHQHAMTPRQLTRAIAPLLRVAEQQKQLAQHNKKVAETHSGIDQMTALQDQQNENINRLMEITPSPLATGNYGHIPSPPGVNVGSGDPIAGLVGGDTPGDFVVDIDQYLQEGDWPGIDDYQTVVDDGIPGATQGLSEVQLDPTLFDMENGFGQGYMSGGLHGMGALAMGAQSNGLGLGCLGVDGMGQVLGTNPSTAVGSPRSPAFSDGTASLLDGNMGNMEENLGGNATKKRRTC